jgi:hypothetical protein
MKISGIASSIVGHAELVLEQMQAEDPLRSHITEVYAAAKRSADITRQLLAFARRQTAAPKLLDLNITVESTLKMLRRLIGEDIDLSWNPKPVHVRIYRRRDRPPGNSGGGGEFHSETLLQKGIGQQGQGGVEWEDLGRTIRFHPKSQYPIQSFFACTFTYPANTAFGRVGGAWQGGLFRQGPAIFLE